jgi:hypothetical protein
MGSILEQLKRITVASEIMALDGREFKAVIGLSPQAFVRLLEPFAQSETELKQASEGKRERPRQRRAGGGRKATLRSVASRLGFLLHYFKGYDTLDDLADQVGFHRSNASRNLAWLLQVLLAALAKLAVLPQREFATPAELAAALAGVEGLVIDATERPVVRPQEATAQKKRIVAKSTSIV